MAEVLRLINKVDRVIAAVAYAAVALILLADVCAREIFSASIWGAQKMAVFGAIIAGFVGLILATSTDQHIRTQVADRLFPLSWDRNVNRFSDCLSAAIYLGLCAYAISYVADSIESNEHAAVLDVPLWPIKLVIPYAFFGCALRHLAFAVRSGLRPAPPDKAE